MAISLRIFVLIGGAIASQLSGQTAQNSRPLTAAVGENWVIRWNRSDDFNDSNVDWRKWQKKPEQFSGWRWDNEGNVTAQDGFLKITLRNDSPAMKGKDGKDRAGSSYTSGMLKSYSKGTYGYYEARIKGAPMFPGASPAFWLYSVIDDAITPIGEVRYSEIDIVELTQRQSHVEGNERITDHNLHAILSNGKPGVPGREWHRPNDARFREAQANEYRTPFDPRTDFHTYGCRVDKELILWYVDGVEVGRKPNQFWHRPMNVALSLGLRAPYLMWKDNKLVLDEKAGGGEFPTQMLVDYVRVWEIESKSE
ncbi:MAG: family 16 glycosylhydrolase [Verrucomicrobiaceae bacterium]|nr:family 16 glycosylhydrolase [Verrucomicrobiaceae bacterium]